MALKKIFGLLAAGGLFIAGYCVNDLLAGPEQLQQRLETKAARTPARYSALMGKAFDFSYRNWVDGQRESGADVSIVQGIRPEIYLTEGRISVGEARLRIVDNTTKPEQTYGVRRINSGIADRLGTNLACGTPEQSIDQFIGTIAEDNGVMENYPEKKAEMIQDYALNGLKHGLRSEAKGLYEKMKAWVEEL